MVEKGGDTRPWHSTSPRKWLTNMMIIDKNQVNVKKFLININYAVLVFN